MADLTPLTSTNPITASSKQASLSTQPGASPKSHQDVVNLLQNQPSLDEFQAAIEYMRKTNCPSFSMKIPSAQTTVILGPLVQSVLPAYWSMIEKDSSLARFKERSIETMRGLPFVRATLDCLQSLTRALEMAAKAPHASQSPSQIPVYISLLEEIFSQTDFASTFWDDINALAGPSSRVAVLWREFVSVIGSGKVIAVVGHAEAALFKSNSITSRSWLGSSSEYSSWLAKCLAGLAGRGEIDDSRRWEFLSHLSHKAIQIGHSDTIARSFCLELATCPIDHLAFLDSFFAKLQPQDQCKLLFSMLRQISRHFNLDSRNSRNSSTNPDVREDMADVAAFLARLIAGKATLAESFSRFTTDFRASPIVPSPHALRIALCALSSSRERMELILERSLERFGDELFLQHSAIRHQEANAQVILLCAGYVQSSSPTFLLSLARSGHFVNGMSKHLASSSPRVKWLGMVVGTAISTLVDKEGSKMKFDDDDLHTDEAMWYLALPQFQDALGRIRPLAEYFTDQSRPKNIQPVAKSTRMEPKSAVEKTKRPKPKIIEIVEESDDDLEPYPKPDSDPEDSEEDPTLINRDKPRAPVYIRDLMAGLRDKENVERHQLFLSTAPSLIRQKKGFGKELSDHSHELLSILATLTDDFETPSFQTHRQEALIALLVSDPTSLAPAFSRLAFEADYSLQQRTSLLIAMGLAARELAGFEDPERTIAPTFPSNRLPAHLHQIYEPTPTPTALDAVSSRLEGQIMQPLALQSAESSNGPKVLQVRPISSRTGASTAAKGRTKRIPNALAAIVADSFFYPLTAAWSSQVVQSQRSGGGGSVARHVLPTYLRTLAILLHACGPGTLALPGMTAEMWDVLFSARGMALAEKEYGILEATMLGLLVVLDVNEDKERLAREQGGRVVETMEWCKAVLGVVGEGGEGDRVRGLADGCVIRCEEIVERWRRVMIGDLVGR